MFASGVRFYTSIAFLIQQLQLLVSYLFLVSLHVVGIESEYFVVYLSCVYICQAECILCRATCYFVSPLQCLVYHMLSNNHAGSFDTLYLIDNSDSDVVTYWTMIRTHVVPDRQQYDGNTPITSYLVHIQLLYGILYTTTSRPNTNTSTITLQSFFSFGQHVIYQTFQRRYKITGSST